MSALQDFTVWNGAFGEMWQDGEWKSNVYSVEASVEITKEDIKMAGDRWVGVKSTLLKGTGTMQGYQVTTELLESIGTIAETRGAVFRTEFIVKLDDPEAYGAYRVRLKNVTFDTIPLINFEHGSIVEQETPFTFVGYEIMDRVVGQ